jgi:hypothetical protein
MTKPLAIDLCCGLFGWSSGLVAEGWEVIGVDLEDMHAKFGIPRPPEYRLIIQDILTLRGSQFRNADLIVASPPCQKYSWMAMPWKRAKAAAAAIRADETGQMLADLNRLFDACFRIQAEASLAAGRHIPMIVENVRGAQPWVGRARHNFGSFYLWGDVPALMPRAERAQKFNPDGTAHGPGSWFAIADSKNRGANGQKNPGFRFDGSGRSFQTESVARHCGTKVPTQSAGRSPAPGTGERFTSRDCGTKNGNDWFGAGEDCSLQRRQGSKSIGRKAASAMIAKIPEPLSRYIATTFKPREAA